METIKRFLGLPRITIRSITTEAIGWGALQFNRSAGDAKLCIGGKQFKHGYGDHAQSRHTVSLPGKCQSFSAYVGVQFPLGDKFSSQICFRLENPDGRILAQSPPLEYGSEAYFLQADTAGATTLILRTIDIAFPEDYTGTPPLANANWCDPTYILCDGTVIRGDDANAQPKQLTPSPLYDGKVFNATPVATLLQDSADYTRWQLDYTAADGKMQIRNTVTEYHDFPVIEWLPVLIGSGDSPSAIIQDFNSLDITLPCPNPDQSIYSHRRLQIRHTLGSKNDQNDFLSKCTTLHDRYGANQACFNTDEGRSSAAHLPFFGLDFSPDHGWNVAIGWSGAWQANFTLQKNLHLTAGMLRTHFRLLPGESIRQPSIILQQREGMDITEGQNLFRQFMLKYHSPHDSSGRLFKTPLPLAVWGGMSSQETIRNIDRAVKEKYPFDVLWMDAGWYGPDREVKNSEYISGSDWARTVGDWRVNRIPHPGGLRPVADAAHRAGMKFMLWLEIERIRPDTPIASAHPEWLLRCPDNEADLLLNLGHPDACQWAIDTVSHIIENEGVDYYRQDFNFNTLPFWRQADAEDRQGVTEAKYIAGLYHFWDTLRKRYPDMLIDNCASGGRRIDSETMSRSICLWRADLLGRPWFDSSECNHTQILGLTQWVPLHSGGTTVVPGDLYGFLSGVASGVSCGICCFPDREQLAAATRMMPFFLHDFYPLTSNSGDYREFCAYACIDRQQQQGFLIVFRRPQTSSDSITLRLPGFAPGEKYLFERFGSPAPELYTGESLSNFTAILPEPRSCALWFFRKA